MTDEIAIQQKPSIKLIRNSKGYTYECKVLDLDVAKLKKITDEIESTYNIKQGGKEMITKFGAKTEEDEKE